MRVLLRRARVLTLMGASAAALKHLQAALRADPDDAVAAKLLRALKKVDALKAAGNDHFAGSRWREAAAAYTECLALCAGPSDAVPPAAVGPGPNTLAGAAYASRIYCNRAAASMK